MVVIVFIDIIIIIGIFIFLTGREKLLFYQAPSQVEREPTNGFCKGALAIEEAKMYCNILYWECLSICPKVGNVNPLVYDKSDCEEESNEPEARQRIQLFIIIVTIW